MKKNKFGLSSFVYMEWLIPMHDYYVSIKKNEAMFEIVLPILASFLCTGIYVCYGKVSNALAGLATILPTAISILIGFTVMLITLLLTSSGENINKIKEIETTKKINNKYITLYQGLHIQFSHSLFTEIILLLLTFFYLFLEGIDAIGNSGRIFLGLEIYLILNILLSILRGIANLYFSFYNNRVDK